MYIKHNADITHLWVRHCWDILFCLCYFWCLLGIHFAAYVTWITAGSLAFLNMPLCRFISNILCGLPV